MNIRQKLLNTGDYNCVQCKKNLKGINLEKVKPTNVNGKLAYTHKRCMIKKGDKIMQIQTEIKSNKNKKNNIVKTKNKNKINKTKENIIAEKIVDIVENAIETNKTKTITPIKKVKEIKEIKEVKKIEVKKEKKEKKEKKITIRSIVYPMLKIESKYKDIEIAVKKEFPESKFNKSHYHWYKQQIKNGSIVI